MGNQRYSEEFRDEAVRQVLDRGYSVKEVSERLGVSAHSLYKWLKAVKPSPEKKRDEELLESKREVLKLKADLRRVEEERRLLDGVLETFSEGHDTADLRAASEQMAQLSRPD